MEQICDYLECNVVGVQGVEICCPAYAKWNRQIHPRICRFHLALDHKNGNRMNRQPTTRHPSASRKTRETRGEKRREEKKREKWTMT